MPSAARRPPPALAVLALAALAALLIGGCGGATEIDYVKASDTVQASLESTREGFGVKVDSVECPSGVKVEPGTRFECTVSFPDGKIAYARLRIRDAEADLSLETLTPTPTVHEG